MTWFGRPSQEQLNETLALADWRRRVNDLYVDVRRIAEPRLAWEHWRAERDRLFLQHPQSPILPERRADYGAVPLFDYDERWRFHVEVAPASEPQEVSAPIGEGTIRMHAFARTKGLKAALGIELTLYWIDGYGGGIFLPFKDGTAGRETYAGGRYLYDGIKGADLGRDGDGRLVVDFNFAYHPSCCHSQAWVCPLSPPENFTAIEVRAGEKL